MSDIAYYSNDGSFSGGDNTTSDSSGVGGGGSVQDNTSADNTGSFNAPGDITGLGFGGAGQGPGGPPGGLGGNYYGGGGARGGGGGGYYGGGAGGFGGMGYNSLGALAQNAGFGADPSGFSLSPAAAGSFAVAPALSAWQQSAPGTITQGANDPNNPQADAPTGTQSGAGQSMWDQLAQVLGGLNPISSAEASPVSSMALANRSMLNPANQAALDRQLFFDNLNQNTLTSSDTAIPFGGPPGGPPVNYPGGGGLSPGAALGGAAAANQGAGTALGLGGVASGTPNDAVSAADRFDLSGQTGANQPSGDAFASRFGAMGGGDAGGGTAGTFAGGFSGVDPNTVGPSFADRFAAAPAGQAVPADRVSAADQLSTSGNADAAIVPTTDTATKLALQGVDSPPPGGPLTGGVGGMDPITGAPSRLTQNDNGFRLAGTSGDTATPPVPGSPADFAQRFSAAPDQQAVSPLSAFTGTPFGPDPNAPFAQQFAPSEPALAANQQSFGDPTQVGSIPMPRAAPGQAAGAPAQTGGGGGGTGAAPAGGGAPGAAPTPGAVSPADMGAVGGGDATPRGQFDRGQRRPGGVHNAIASIFGGGQLGDTVASLMLQLGIPAALIFAATRGGGGGGGLGMLGGRAAMSGAGRGGFAPQFARNLFPGTGVPPWLIPGVAGAMVGQRLDQPPQQPAQDHPPVAPGRAPGPQVPQTPPSDAPFVQRGYTTPRGGNMPLPRPNLAFTPEQAAQPGGTGSLPQSISGPGGMNAYTGAVFSLESDNDPNIVTKGNLGLGQFSPGQFGITAQNWRDPAAQRRAMQLETANNTPYLRAALGHDPTAAELYIAHQQGLAGGTALLQAARDNPNMLAWQVVSRFYRSPQVAATAISNNPTDNLRGVPVRNITAGQFVRSWTARFNRAYVPYMQRNQPQIAMAQ